MSGFRPAPYNPRKISPAALEGLRVSIAEFGDLSGIVVNRRTGNFVGGHQRLAALGVTEIPDPPPEEIGGLRVRVVDWPASKEKAANIAANSSAISGEFTDGLEALLDEIKRDDAALFDALRMPELAALFPEKPLVEIDPPPIAPPANPVSKLGELYHLGPHRLLCGDSTKAEDVGRLFGDASPAALFATDPPYGVAYGDETGSANSKFAKIANDENDGPKLQGFLETVFRAWSPRLRDDAAWYLWHAQLTQGFFAAAAAAVQLLVHRQIVWVKPSLIMGHGDFHWRHELCFYGWRKGHRPRWLADRKQTTVWEIGRETDGIHPTQKPVEIFERPMTYNTEPGEICAEPFAGSGSQFIAAARLNRRCFGMELEPRYCDVIRKRWGDFAREAGMDPGVDAL